MSEKATIAVRTHYGVDNWTIDRDGVQGYDVHQDSGYLHIIGGSGNATYAPGCWDAVSMVDKEDVDTDVKYHISTATNEGVFESAARQRARAHFQ